MRAKKSLKLYPLPITTESDACALEGVGNFTARRMLRGLAATTSTTSVSRSAGSCRSSNINGDDDARDEENVEPLTQSLISPTKRCARQWQREQQQEQQQRARLVDPTNRSDNNIVLDNTNNNSDGNSYTSDDNGNCDNDIIGRSALFSSRPQHRPGFSLASNISALRRENDVTDSEDDSDYGGSPRTPDVTPRRPTSRARRGKTAGKEKEVNDGRVGATSEAPKVFVGMWEAFLVVDNREHECTSVQVTRGESSGAREGGRWGGIGIEGTYGTEAVNVVEFDSLGVQRTQRLSDLLFGFFLLEVSYEDALCPKVCDGCWWSYSCFHENELTVLPKPPSSLSARAY